MKIEAECNLDTSCPAYGYRQLLDAHKTRRLLAVDQDGNDVTCPFCGRIVWAVAVAPVGALFPVGTIMATDAAKRVLGFEKPDDPLQWMSVGEPLLKRHQRGDHGSVTEEARGMNVATLDDPMLGIAEGTTGIIVSMYVVYRDPIWFVTNHHRTETLICLPEEYGAVST